MPHPLLRSRLMEYHLLKGNRVKFLFLEIETPALFPVWRATFSRFWIIFTFSFGTPRTHRSTVILERWLFTVLWTRYGVWILPVFSISKKIFFAKESPSPNFSSFRLSKCENDRGPSFAKCHPIVWHRVTKSESFILDSMWYIRQVDVLISLIVLKMTLELVSLIIIFGLIL